jgi:hypothetical protein
MRRTPVRPEARRRPCQPAWSPSARSGAAACLASHISYNVCSKVLPWLSISTACVGLPPERSSQCAAQAIRTAGAAASSIICSPLRLGLRSPNGPAWPRIPSPELVTRECLFSLGARAGRGRGPRRRSGSRRAPGCSAAPLDITPRGGTIQSVGGRRVLGAVRSAW